jgi:CRISPR-associated protein Cst2
MPRRIFTSIILKVTGNVNADAGIGTRIPLKKIITWRQEIRPFVSARCIKRCIRERLYEKGFEIDPLQLVGKGEEKQLGDIGDPIRYIDDDLFGFLIPQEPPIRRSGPIKVSHLISLRHAEVKVEFAARFPRDFIPESRDIIPDPTKRYPAPFEIELADWLGKLDVIVSDRIGKFDVVEELSEGVKVKLREKNIKIPDSGLYNLDPKTRFNRLKTFLEVLLWEGWSFPRGSQSPSTTDYYYAVIALTDRFVPMFGYIDIRDDGKLNEELLAKFREMYRGFIEELFIIDYKNSSFTQYVREKPSYLKEVSKNASLNWEEMNKIINRLCYYIIPELGPKVQEPTKEA